jgi:signal transduction histidine kinase
MQVQMPLTDVPQEHVALLESAFRTFTEATQSLETSYHELEKQVDLLNAKLKKKNAALARNLKEKERLANYLRNILESLDVGIIVCDQSGKISLFNQVSSQMVQTPVAQAVGKPVGDLFAGFAWSGFFQDVLEETQQPVVETQAFRQGEQFHTVGLWRSALKDRKNRSIGAIFILQDRTQLKRLEKQLARKDRLAEMGEMAIHVAHEIRNPLGSIELFASVLKKELHKQQKKKVLCDHILSSVKTLDHIISNLLQFTRPHKPSYDRVPLRRLLEEFIQFIQPILQQSAIELEMEIAPARDLDLVADRELIWQVFLNLVLNAIQAMPDGGSFFINVSPEKNFTIPEKDPFVSMCKKDRFCYARVSFRDTGRGMTPEEAKKIFTPFFSTRRKGTGLGLSIVQTIMDQHEGIIEVESEKGAGSLFKLFLPACRREER